MPDQVVIWDIDGTLITSSLERRFLDHLVKHGYASPSHLFRSFWRLMLDWPPQYHKIKAFYIRGLSVDLIREQIDLCWNESILPDISSVAVNAVYELRDLGAKQLLLSGTLRPLAEKMAEHLGIVDVIASDLEVRDGMYTGRLLAPHPKNIRKMQYADKWLTSRGLQWDCTISIADHWGDRFLLSRANKAIVVNPKQQLRKMAKRKGWLILDGQDDLSSVVSAINSYRSNEGTEVEARTR